MERLVGVGLIVGLLIGGCTTPANFQQRGPEHPSTTFIPIVVDATRFGGEIGLAASPQGAWYACSPRGVGAGTALWRSLDGGRSFEFLGQDPAHGTSPYDVILPVRSGPGDVGGGDCDITTDQAGNVYLADLWAGSISVATSKDRGTTWTGTPLSTTTPPVDRPWAVGGAPGEVFVTAAQFASTGCEQHGTSCPPVGGIIVAHSTDAGQTFTQTYATTDPNRFDLNGNIARSGDGTLYVIYTKKISEGILAATALVSTDNGTTWTEREIARQQFPPQACSAIMIFPIIAADTTGGVHAAWVLDNPATQRHDLFYAASPDHGQHWTTHALTDRPGTRAFPWIAVAPTGTVGITWYESNVTMRAEYTNDPLGQAHLACDWTNADNAPWHVHYAAIENATSPQPRITESLAQPEPIHTGPLDRPYAERMGLSFDPQGHAGIAYAADVPEGQARPMFAILT